MLSFPRTGIPSMMTRLLLWTCDTAATSGAPEATGSTGKKVPERTARLQAEVGERRRGRERRERKAE